VIAWGSLALEMESNQVSAPVIVGIGMEAFVADCAITRAAGTLSSKEFLTSEISIAFSPGEPSE